MLAGVSFAMANPSMAETDSQLPPSDVVTVAVTGADTVAVAAVICPPDGEFGPIYRTAGATSNAGVTPVAVEPSTVRDTGITPARRWVVSRWPGELQSRRRGSFPD
jgi:hypothetical protein